MIEADVRKSLVLAADVPLAEGVALYQRVREWFGTVKVGLSLFVEHGPRAVEPFQSLGAEVFLDLKLHDIPATVRLATERAAALEVAYLTVHASGGRAMIQAAREAVASRRTRILAVTVLTSFDEGAWGEVSAEAVSPSVDRLGRLAADAGAQGLVCSPHELASLRPQLPRGFLLCTPGIRPRGSPGDDQSRTAEPQDALAQGASLLVVGRPVTRAAQPEEVAQNLFRAASRAVASVG